VDLDAYFDRIGWRGSCAPTLEVLGGILVRHMTAIPFENLDVLLGNPPRLELGSLERKLVGARRGGYCYEHATLFAAVLRELGFDVRTHSARVTMMTPRSAAPRTHMFLTVGNLGPVDLVLDPGFGGAAPRVPVPLDGTPAGAHRIMREGGEIVLEQAGQRLWMSSLEHDIPIDFEMANHFTATHPASHFTRMITMRVFDDAAEVRIRNRDVTLIKADESQTYQLADRAELRAVVAKHFGFDLPALETICVPMIPEWQ